jgi:uncharacterized membrane protein YeaQ/YmgE (transglycosylase-associated protein family)
MTTPLDVLIVLILALACGFAADAIGKRRGHRGLFWLGLILGVIGVAIAALVPRAKGRETPAPGRTGLFAAYREARRYDGSGDEGPR